MDEAAFNKFSESMEERYRFTSNERETAYVKFEMASRQFRYIRIFHLPPETDDKEIGTVMGRYGKVRQHIRERYPNAYGYPVYSGIRGVHMEVEQEIPANLFIGHFRARVFYEGLKNKCFLCKAENHVKAECPKLASLRQNEIDADAEKPVTRSYSQVAANIRLATVTASSSAAPPTISMTKLPVKPYAPRVITPNPTVNSAEHQGMINFQQPTIIPTRASTNEKSSEAIISPANQHTNETEGDRLANTIDDDGASSFTPPANENESARSDTAVANSSTNFKSPAMKDRDIVRMDDTETDGEERSGTDYEEAATEVNMLREQKSGKRRNASVSSVSSTEADGEKQLGPGKGKGRKIKSAKKVESVLGAIAKR